MRKIISLTFLVILLANYSYLSAQGTYPPPAGQAGSTAIYTDSSIIKSWATGIELYRGWVQISDTSVYYNGSNKATFAYPSIALGKAQESSYDVVSLGDGGVATLTFDRPIVNGQGADFTVFENGFSDTFLELAFVEVSSDGERFVRFPAVSLTPTTEQVGGFGALDATNLYNFAGNYRQGYGTPFDLEEIKDSSNIDLNNIRFVRVVDVVGNIETAYATYDSQGNKVNDPWPTPFHSCGFDLDGIGVINGGQPYSITTLNEIPLAKDTYWYPESDTSWASGLAKFRFFKDANFEYGFNYTNLRNDTIIDQNLLETSTYSSIAGGDMNATDTSSSVYATAFVSINWLGDNSNMPVETTFKDDESYAVSGFYVTNNTYTYFSMVNGDMFAKKFGGATGDDPDYFKLLVWGEKEDGSATDTVEFYLADFRFSDNSKDYIVKEWRWVDLTSLGKVKKLRYNLESTDVGMWGMNTPSYFCLDNLTIIPDAEPVIVTPIADVNVNMNAQPVNVDLSSVFTAYDPTNIELAVASNSNSGLVSTNLSGITLTLTFAAHQHGEAEIVIRATLDSKTVTDTFKVTVNNTTTGIDNTIANNVKVYPNPCTSIINVECDADSRIILIDIYGKTIKEQISTGNTVQLTTEQLTPGYYILKIIGQTNNTAVKILKQ